MNRGQDIYLDDVDRQDFLNTLAEARQKTGWQIHAYCLRGNHHHLVVETPNANLAAELFAENSFDLSTFALRFCWFVSICQLAKSASR